MSGFVQPFHYLAEAAERSPDGVAISTVDNDMTFGELLDTARRMAGLLRESGVKPGDVVAVRAPALFELVAVFAIFHEAAVGTGVPAGYVEAGGKAIDWIVTTAPVASFPPQRQIILDSAALERMGTAEPPVSPRAYPKIDAVCRIAFSSGTTGRPKAIPFTIDTLYERCIEGRERWMLDRPFMCHLGLGSILAVMSFFSAVVLGDTYISPGEGADVLTQLRRHRVACLVASPHQLGVVRTSLAKMPDAQLPDLSVILSTGSVLPEFLARQLETLLGARIVVAYASSEAGTMALRNGVASPDGFAGTVAPGVDMRVLDDRGNVVPDGVVGHIAVKRARQPQHYLDDDRGQTFIDGYFMTGDTGHLRGDQLYLAGRVSEIINAAGIKVDPARVEAAAYDFPGVQDAAVCGYTDATGLETIALVFVSETPVVIDDLVALLRSRLGESAPRHVARVEKIPRTDSGKVMRDEVARLFTQRLALP